MNSAGLCGQSRKFDRGGGGGEIDHGLRADKGLQRVIRHDDAQGRPAHRLAHIPADPGMTRPLDTAHQLRAF